jgi:hypothetical protein
MNAAREHISVKDLDTGQEFVSRPQYHKFLYLKMEYWGLLGAAASIVITFLFELDVVRF